MSCFDISFSYLPWRLFFFFFGSICTTFVQEALAPLTQICKSAHLSGEFKRCGGKNHSGLNRKCNFSKMIWIKNSISSLPFLLPYQYLLNIGLLKFLYRLCGPEWINESRMRRQTRIKWRIQEKNVYIRWNGRLWGMMPEAGRKGESLMLEEKIPYVREIQVISL